MNSEEKNFGITGLLSLLLGGLAAMLLLMSQPVSERPLRNEAVEPGVAYLQSGQSGGGAGWERKWLSWQSGSVQAAEFSEAELNVWIQQSWGASMDKSGEPWFSWLQPNFRIHAEEELQVALVLNASPPGYAREIPFWSIGRFDGAASAWKISNGQAWVGQFPLAKVPLIGNWVAVRMMQRAFASHVPDEFQSAWGSSQTVVVENQRLSFRR